MAPVRGKGSVGLLAETSADSSGWLEPGGAEFAFPGPRGTASSGPSVGTGRLGVAADVPGCGAGAGLQPIAMDIASSEKVNAAIDPMPAWQQTRDERG
ncbi:hypothetical protein ACW7G0_10685 [Lysobacter sp. A286]